MRRKQFRFLNAVRRLRFGLKRKKYQLRNALRKQRKHLRTLKRRAEKAKKVAEDFKAAVLEAKKNKTAAPAAPVAPVYKLIINVAADALQVKRLRDAVA